MALPDLGSTIVALSTPPGVGALGVIRLSGPAAIGLAQQFFSRKNLANAPGNTLHFGQFLDSDGRILDEIVLSLFRAPHSYTREDVVELSCHGSPYILNKVIELLIAAGARAATPGEFTLRAFLNGALNLAQAEAVADLVASTSAMGHTLAMQQLRGGYSEAMRALRAKLVEFAALVELELDFSEEDVEFADRSQLLAAVHKTLTTLHTLVESFAAGNALKQGIPTVIIGAPNAGKSTLLNRLLGDNKAIVSAIPGTTRDVIEDRLVLSGYEFRLMDTAGLRETEDEIEQEGVRRSLASVAEAQIVCLVYDASSTNEDAARAYSHTLTVRPDATILLVANKHDLVHDAVVGSDTIATSALMGEGMDALIGRLVSVAAGLYRHELILTNQRHVAMLRQAEVSLQAVERNLTSGLTPDLLALDIRHALDALGEITGEVTSDEVLGAIFSKFCIGK